MDLNHHYAQHQLSVMRAAAAPSRVGRTKHLAAAGLCAYRIHNYQRANEAAAAEGWFLKMENLDWIEEATSGLHS
jgi:hypothetical protein